MGLALLAGQPFAQRGRQAVPYSPAGIEGLGTNMSRREPASAELRNMRSFGGQSYREDFRSNEREDRSNHEDAAIGL